MSNHSENLIEVISNYCTLLYAYIAPLQYLLIIPTDRTVCRYPERFVILVLYPIIPHDTKIGGQKRVLHQKMQPQM